MASDPGGTGQKITPLLVLIYRQNNAKIHCLPLRPQIQLLYACAFQILDRPNLG
jgi:hypothetical protein